MNPHFPIIDASAWVGQYPFRGIADSSIDHLVRKMRELGVVRAVVSPFEAVFWENNLDAYEQWSAGLAEQDNLELWPVVNPAMPGQLDEFRRLYEIHRPRGFRLTPNYHGYSLYDPRVAELMDFARRNRLVAQLFVRLADERWHWMLKMPAVPDSEVLYFTSVFAGWRMIVSGLNTIDPLMSRLRQQPRLCVDISRLHSCLFAVEQLVGQAPWEQVLYGSLWPIQIPQATLWQVLDARIEERIKSALLHDNFVRLMDGLAARPDPRDRSREIPSPISSGKGS